MSESMLVDVLVDQHDAILVAAKARLSGDDEMAAVAGQREMTESALSSQVIDFWLQAIRTDLTLGANAAMAQNLSWLVRLRDGHGLAFDDHLVMGMFDDISAEIVARVSDGRSLAQFAAYADGVRDLIVAEFPAAREPRR